MILFGILMPQQTIRTERPSRHAVVRFRDESSVTVTLSAALSSSCGEDIMYIKKRFMEFMEKLVVPDDEDDKNRSQVQNSRNSFKFLTFCSVKSLSQHPRTSTTKYCTLRADPGIYADREPSYAPSRRSGNLCRPL